jgi:hypothetical protein
MKQSDGIFLLISSMTAAEKRYFRSFAKRHVIGEENRYLKLFDLIERQTGSGKYNETLVLGEMNSATLPAQLSNTKNYLHGLILRSMRLFSDETTVTRTLQARIADIQYLLDKGLYAKAREMLRKSRKLAQLYEKHLYELQLISIERKLMRFTPLRNAQREINATLQAERYLIGLIQNESEMANLYDQVFMLIRSGLVAEKQQAFAQKLLSSPLIKEKSSSNTFSVETLRLLSLSDLLLLCGDHKRSRMVLHKLITHYDRHPHQFHDDPLRYINILNNYLNTCFRLQRFDEFPGTIRRMLQVGVSQTARFEIFKNATFLQLLYLINTRQLDEGLKLIPQIEEGLMSFDKKLPLTRKLSFCYNVMMLYFFTERFQEALRWAGKLLERDYPDVRRDLQHASLLFRLVILFERGHHDILDNMLQNTRRRLRKTDQYQPFEQFLIEFLKELTITVDSRKRKALFKKGIEFFDAQLPEFQKNLLADEIRIWMTARATGQTLATLF